MLNYSRDQQMDLLKDIGFKSPSWEDLALLLIVALTVLSAAGAGWAWWERQHQDPWVRQSAQLRRALRTLGLDARPHESPRVLAKRIRSRFGTRGNALVALLAQFERQRYGRRALARPQGWLTRALRREARQLARQPAAGRDQAG